MPLISTLFLFVALFLTPAFASADDGLLVLVTEVDAAGEPTFWWSSSTPAWTATDAQLRGALEREGAGFATPGTTANLSKIYRRPDPTDANALAMASVLGHDRVLVGTATVTRSALAPLGSVGVSVRLDVRLLTAGNGAPEVLNRFDLTRVSWALTQDEADEAARAEAAAALARALTGAISRSVGPVGIASTELRLGVRDAGTTGHLDAVRRALLGYAGVTDVGVSWASEGIVVLEVNPGVSDPSASVKQYASLLSREPFEDFGLVASASKFPETIEFRVVEAR